MEPDGLDGDAASIWAAQLDMYEGFLAGDRPRIDAHIWADATMWDSEHEPLVRGLAGLNEVRAARPVGTGVPAVVSLDALEPVIDVWGDVAVSRHVLTVVVDDASVADERVRVTGVWRLIDGEWLCVHNHEDVVHSNTRTTSASPIQLPHSRKGQC